MTLFHKHKFQYNEDKTAIWCECGEIKYFKHECEIKEFFTCCNTHFSHTLQKEINQEIKYFGCNCGKMKIMNTTTGQILHDDFNK